MEKNSVWLLEFDDLCADCNGVFSTKEKATEALYIHKDRCDDIWLDFKMVDSEADCDLYRFTVSGVVENVTISKYYIDELQKRGASAPLSFLFRRSEHMGPDRIILTFYSTTFFNQKSIGKLHKYFSYNLCNITSCNIQKPML